MSSLPKALQLVEKGIAANRISKKCKPLIPDELRIGGFAVPEKGRRLGEIGFGELFSVIHMHRSVSITVHLSRDEVEQLTFLAQQENLKLSVFMRRELTRTAHLTRDTAILAGEIGRVGELVKRGFEKAGVDMKEVAAVVGAIDARVFIAQLPGVSVGE